MNQPSFPGMADPGIQREANIDPTGEYRYGLARHWGNLAAGYTNWIMLNPSTADGIEDDRTIRRCIRFTRDWGFDNLVVTNLFAYRSTDPQALFSVPDPIGPQNDLYLASTALGAARVVLAWGHLGWIRERAAHVQVRLAELGVACHCLGVTQHGEPKHPLFVPAITELQTFDLREN